jgi:hypothetical protein
MSIYYFDADAQVKYFINEPGSLWVRQLADEVDVDGDPLRMQFTWPRLSNSTVNSQPNKWR